MPLSANLIAARIPDMPAPIIKTSRLDFAVTKSDFELPDVRCKSLSIIGIYSVDTLSPTIKFIIL